MSVKTQIDRINGEVATQEDLIAQIRSAIETLPEAGAGGGGDDFTLFGTYMFHPRPQVNANNMEIVFEPGQVQSYFINKDSQSMELVDVESIVFANQIVEFVSADSNFYNKKCNLNPPSYDEFVWTFELENGIVSLLTDGWELVIVFMEPTTLDQDGYNNLASMIEIPLRNPYNAGRTYGYDEGYSDGYDEGSSEGGFPYFYFQDDTGFGIVVNGAYGGAAPYQPDVGVISLISTYASLEELQAVLAYCIPYEDGSDIFELSLIWTQIDGTDIVLGIIPEAFGISSGTYGLLLTKEPIL